jgi:glutaredoxin|tara:strand:+ start:417 stop:632 length:216 start_codon:yes stop_codon:yes gene_type:complete
MAKKMLDDMGLSYTEIDIEENNISRDKLSNLTGGHTVPQIIINDKVIGGFTQLLQLNQSGQLKELLKDGTE